MTARLVSCDDLTKNEADLKRIRELFTTMHTSTTAVSLLLPWFPSPGRKSVKKSTTELFCLLQTHVEARRSAEPKSDAIDLLIAEGETSVNIAGASFVPKLVEDANSDSTIPSSLWGPSPQVSLLPASLVSLIV